MTDAVNDELIEVEFIVNQRQHGRQVVVLGEMDNNRRRQLQYAIFSVLNSKNYKKLLNILPKEDGTNE